MKFLAWVFLVFLAASLAVFSQTVGAALRGTVNDPSGAGIPSAGVQIHNVETGVSRILRADAGGRWREPVVQPGEYEIHIYAPGFQPMVRKGVHLAVDFVCLENEKDARHLVGK